MTYQLLKMHVFFSVPFVVCPKGTKAKIAKMGAKIFKVAMDGAHNLSTVLFLNQFQNRLENYRYIFLHILYKKTSLGSFRCHSVVYNGIVHCCYYRQPEKRSEYQTLILNDRPFGNALAVSFCRRCARLHLCAYNFHCSIQKRRGKLGRNVSFNESYVLYR